MNTQKPIHGAPQSKDVPSDMQDAPPVKFGFKVGDVVTFTNDYGVNMKSRIRGFAKEVRSYGGFVYLEYWKPTGWIVDAWWFPVKPESIS